MPTTRQSLQRVATKNKLPFRKSRPCHLFTIPVRDCAQRIYIPGGTKFSLETPLHRARPVLWKHRFFSQRSMGTRFVQFSTETIVPVYSPNQLTSLYSPRLNQKTISPTFIRFEKPRRRRSNYSAKIEAPSEKSYIEHM